jgi:hypothetical protein
LDALLGGWRLEASPLVAALAEGGPTRLLEPAAGSGFLPDPAGYAGKCHLCWSLRCHLAGSGEEGNALRPASLYLTS